MNIIKNIAGKQHNFLINNPQNISTYLLIKWVIFSLLSHSTNHYLIKNAPIIYKLINGS